METLPAEGLAGLGFRGEHLKDNNSMKVVLVNTTVREMTMVEQETCVCLLPLVVMDINLHQIFFAAWLQPAAELRDVPP